MQTSTSQRTRSEQRTKAAQALQYPELLDHRAASSRLFWVSAWLRALAEFEAFQTFASSSPCRTARQHSDRLGMAISGACLALEEDFEEITEELLNSGGILFAWEGTTVLQGGAA